MINGQEYKTESIEVYPACKPVSIKNESNSFSLLSWNIIHKDFVDPEDYTYATEKQLNWNYRLPKIKNIISKYNTDIVCLQEIDKKTFAQDIGNHFAQKQHNYSFKVNIPKKSKVDYSQAIMWKNDKFECKYEDYRTRCTILLLENKKERSNCLKCKNNHHRLPGNML